MASDCECKNEGLKDLNLIFNMKDDGLSSYQHLESQMFDFNDQYLSIVINMKQYEVTLSALKLFLFRLHSDSALTLSFFILY